MASKVDDAPKGGSGAGGVGGGITTPTAPSSVVAVIVTAPMSNNFAEELLRERFKYGDGPPNPQTVPVPAPWEPQQFYVDRTNAALYFSTNNGWTSTAVTPAPTVPPPLMIPLAGFSVHDATEGQQAIGGAPVAFRRNDYVLAGLTLSLQLVLTGMVTAGQQVTINLTDVTNNIIVSADFINTQAMAAYGKAIPANVVLDATERLLTLSMTVSGALPADVGTVFSAALLLTWTVTP